MDWTWARSVELVAVSYLWLVGAVAPAGALATWLVTALVTGSFLDGFLGALAAVGLFILLFAVIAAVGAAVAVPFTQVLGRALRHTRSRLVHVAAHAVLGGVLAAVCMQGLLLAFEDDHLSWQYPLALSVPAGLAAAIGRWRFDETKPRRAAQPALP